MTYIKRNSVSLFFLVIFLMAGCSPVQTAATKFSIKPNDVVTATSTPPTVVANTDTLTSTRTRKPTNTKKPTSTPTITSTPLPTFPPSTLVYLGTPVFSEGEIINGENFHRLTHVAQWGRGMILGTAFTPDGSKFVVGSAFGLAVYDKNVLESVPKWIPFDTSVDYVDMAFSQDGKYLRLNNTEMKNKILDFSTGLFVVDPGEQSWLNPMSITEDYGGLHFMSHDNKMEVKAHLTYDTENMNIEYSIREVYDRQTKELLYEFPDATFYVMFNEVHQPESCDWESTVICGNAYYPVAFTPYAGVFSPMNDTFTILYRAPGYRNFNRYSLLRIYDSQNGSLLGMVGNMHNPVQTFSYSPDGNQLLVAYVDGSIHLWDVRNKISLFGAWHFNDYLRRVEFTEDDQYLVLWRPDALEFRSVQNGALRSRFEMVTYALSPINDNVVAIAGRDNVIRIVEIDSARTILRIPAHEYQIFSVQFSPDGRYLVSSGQDCKIKLWDVETGKFLHSFEETRANGYEGGPPLENDEWGNSRIFIYSFYFFENSNRLMGFGSWGTMVNWDINSGATNYVVYSVPMQFYNGMMTVSPHYPSSFYVDSDLQRFYISDMTYDLQTGENIKTPMPSLTPTPEPGELSVPQDCSQYGLTSVDGKLKFTMGYGKRDGQICVLDAQNNQILQIIPVILEPDNDFYIEGISLSHDGTTLVIGSSMGTVDVYQITN